LLLAAVSFAITRIWLIGNLASVPLDRQRNSDPSSPAKLDA
jgi:hypothetical protein